MSKENKHIPMWPCLIGLVSDRILLAIVYVSYAITAESYYLLVHKNGVNRTHKIQIFHEFLTARTCAICISSFHRHI